ncbi:hypothetical protein HKX48_003876 [Thoreauomyces humboldtii]|nr:hypothetical protein HKX48_003876 [Thoreauomyces humboldtii]
MAEQFPPGWGFDFDLTGLLGVDETQLLSFQDLLGTGTIVPPPPEPGFVDSLDSLLLVNNGRQYCNDLEYDPRVYRGSSSGLSDYQIHSPTGQASFDCPPPAVDSPPPMYPGLVLKVEPTFPSVADSQAPMSFPIVSDTGPSSGGVPPAKQRKKSSATSRKTSAAKPAADEPCRARKLKCDGSRPHCATCARSTQGPSQCYYHSDHGGPRPRRKGEKQLLTPAEVKELEAKVFALEKLLASAAPSERTSTSPVDIKASPDTMGAELSSRSQTWPTEGFFEARKGDGHLSPQNQQVSLTDLLTGASTVGEPPLATELRNLTPVVTPRELPESSALVKKKQLSELVTSFKEKLAIEDDVKRPEELQEVLPDLNTLRVRRDLIDLYFDNKAAHAPFDFLHRDSFLRGLDDESPLLLFALYAVVATTSNDKRTRNSASSFYARARKLISEHLEFPTLSGLQGITLLCSASMSQGLMSAGWMYLGMACRMAMFLRMDVDPEGLGLQWAHAESRRRLWWSIVNLDRVKSAITCRTPFLGKQEVPTVNYPCPDGLWDASDADGNLPLHLVGVPFDSITAAYVKFLPIYAQAIDYSRNALKNGVSLDDVCPTAAILEAHIHAWMRSLPPSVHAVPESNTFTCSNTDAKAGVPYQAVTCFLLYNCALCLIRRPRLLAALKSPCRTSGVVDAINQASKPANDLGVLAGKLVAPRLSSPDSLHAHHMTFINTLGLTEAAFIHLIASTFAGSSRDTELFERHQCRFRDLLKLLRVFGRRSPPARLMADVLAIINDQLLHNPSPRLLSSRRGRLIKPSSQHLDSTSSDSYDSDEHDGGSAMTQRGKDHERGRAHDTWVREMVSEVCGGTVSTIIREFAAPVEFNGDPLVDLERRKPKYVPRKL